MRRSRRRSDAEVNRVLTDIALLLVATMLVLFVVLITKLTESKADRTTGEDVQASGTKKTDKPPKVVEIRRQDGRMVYAVDGKTSDPSSPVFQDAVKTQHVVVKFPTETVVDAGPDLGDWISQSTGSVRKAGARKVKIWIERKGGKR